MDIGGGGFTAAAACATYALIRANEDGWSDAAVWGLLGLAVVLLAVFVTFESRSRHPMFELALLRNRSFVVVLLAGLLLTFAAFATFTYTSIWLQSVLGLSAIGAGSPACRCRSRRSVSRRYWGGFCTAGGQIW